MLCLIRAVSSQVTLQMRAVMARWTVLVVELAVAKARTCHARKG